MTERARTIAIFNTSPDVIELLRIALEDKGYNTVGVHVTDIQRGHMDLSAFVESHAPDAIIYDIPPPYRESWQFAQLLRSTVHLKDVPFVFTTTNKAAMERITGASGTIEFIEKPFDFQKVVEVVHEKLQAGK